MPKVHSYSAWILYALIGGVFLTLALAYPAAYVQVTYEDMYGEWLQTWLFVAVFVLAIPLARRRWVYRWFFALLALAGFYTFMEEISWGQRLFAIESPEFFAVNNVQGETNLHNFFTGPESTLLKDIIEYTLASALIGYGLLYPLLLRVGWRPARWLNQLGVASPPLYLWVFFVTAASLEIGWFTFNEAEVAEVLVGTALIIMLLHYRVADPDVAMANGVPQPAVAKSLRCGQLYLGVFAVLVVLAYLTTSWFYSLPGRAAGIDARLARGFDKFGGRMEKDGRWQAAADLYLSGFALGPQNLPMLHKALVVFQTEGDEGSYQKYYRIMLDTTAAELKANDASVENLLMLAANYADIDEQAVAHKLLAQALTTAAQRVAASPDESETYYWLGRAYQQRGDYGEARRAYEQAKVMDPGRGRYILALRSLNNIQPEN
jgi:hypothetical protein